MEHLPREPWILLVDYVLSALIWTMAGRFLLGLFVPPDWDNYIWRFFRRVTDPVLAVVQRITPSFMVDPFMPLVAVWWLFLAALASAASGKPLSVIDVTDEQLAAGLKAAGAARSDHPDAGLLRRQHPRRRLRRADRRCGGPDRP